MVKIRELAELSPIVYSDSDRKINITCYADTFVYHKLNSSERNLVAMRFGGYPEQVRGMADALNHNAGASTEIEGHTIILKAPHSRYKRSISHDGIYAEGMIVALDDENSGKDESGKKKKNEKRKMYIFCEEGNTDSLYAEIDKKTMIPLIPEFKDYVLEECIKRKLLVPLEVLSASVRFDAYMLELDEDEKDMESVINDGLKQGRIVIPNSVPGTGFENIETVSQYLNKYGINIATRIRESFNPLFDPTAEDICDELKRINGNLKKNVGYTLYPAQLAVAEAVKRRLDKSKFAMVVAECGSGKTKIGSVALAAHQQRKKTFNVILCPSHITKKWVREIEETLPNTKADIIRSLADVDRIYKDYQNGSKSVYAIVSKERARDGYMRKPAAVYSKIRQQFVCPWCNETIMVPDMRDDGMVWKEADCFSFTKENNHNHKCRECGKPLWTVLNPNDLRLSSNKWIKIGGYGFIHRDFLAMHKASVKSELLKDKIQEIIDNPDKAFIGRGAHRRYAISKYIAERIKSIDGLILDELHRAPVEAK